MFFHFCAHLEGPSQHTRSNDNAKAKGMAAAVGPQCFSMDLNVIPFHSLGWAQHPQVATAMPKPNEQLPQWDLNVSQWTSMFSIPLIGVDTAPTHKKQWQCHSQMKGCRTRTSMFLNGP